MGAFSVAGFAANDAWGMGHHASEMRILCVFLAVPFVGAVFARLIIQEARACSTPVLALAGFAGLVAGLALDPWFLLMYGGSMLARWLEPAPPPPPYLYPSHGVLAFVFLASWLASAAATFYRSRPRPEGRISIWPGTRSWNE